MVQISHSLKKIIIILKSHHKFRIDITQKIERHVQLHRHVDCILIINSNSDFQNI